MFEQPAGKPEKDRSRSIMLLSGVAVLIVIGLIIFASSFKGDERQVEMAHAGSPEYDSYAQFVKVTITDKRTGERLGNRYARIIGYVQNTGDKALSGLELRGVILGFNNEVRKDKVITPIPNQKDTLSPNERLNIDLNIEPVPDPAEIMEMTMQLHGLKVRQ